MRQTLTATALSLALAMPAAAGTPEPLPGSEIEAMIEGMTVEGSMLSSGPYAEFYAEDGTIRGEGYTGAWTVEDDAMCFDYGEGPDCWQVGREGGEVLWIQEGEVRGTGRLVEGNPNGF